MSDSQFCQVHWRDADLVNADIDWELEDLPDDSKVVAHSHAYTPLLLTAALFLSYLLFTTIFTFVLLTILCIVIPLSPSFIVVVIEVPLNLQPVSAESEQAAYEQEELEMEQKWTDADLPMAVDPREPHLGGDLPMV
ncbi:MAG: hypothetical protein JOS17DRAFT_749889 [Linnemannia elongata]|nr:MAG: hypothetical protein JOS17DRAFT_749889 [Linnemannia elongata]